MPPRKTTNGNGMERWRGEVTAKLEDIPRRIDELGARIERALTAHVQEDHSSFEKLDERVSEVEKAEWKLTGKVAVVAGLVGAAMSAIVEESLRRYFGG